MVYDAYMTKYQSGDPASIEALFSLEGDALDRHGFCEPDSSTAPEELQPINPGFDPTGQSEWSDPLHYTRANSRAVRAWRAEEAAGGLGGVGIRKAFDF